MTKIRIQLIIFYLLNFLYFIRIPQKYMSSSFQYKSNNGKVWFSGKINKNAGEVISSNVGRIDNQQ